ncbi:MAG: hypothetical protein IK990_01315 [Ruminiclostridium sp.]|nr:hypothetical protein [Ruminiclostridium sp.]
MNARDKLFTALDMLTDEQIEGIYLFLKNLAGIDGEPTEEMQLALRESEDIELHPEKYRSYSSFGEIIKEINSEV